MSVSIRILASAALMLATVAVGVAPSASLPGTDLGSRSEDWSDYPPRPAVNCEETIKPPLPRCVNFDCDDPLFKRYPPKGTRITAHCSELTVPFTIYDNEVMAMFGSADLAALRAITEGSGYHPVATDAGRGIAMFFAAFQRDGNTVPYFESGIMFSVNDTPVTVASENLYVHVSEMLRPGNEVWFHKLLLSHDMPIEYGRELLGYDKNPAAQNMVVTTDVTMSAVEQTFSFKDPQFNPVVSRRAVVDRNPASRAESLRLLASAPNGGDAVARALSEGGLIRVNAVSPDVLERTDGIVKSHLVARVKTIELGLWDEASSLSVNAGSDYGAALGLIDFRPVVNVYMPFRTILDNGHLP
ncbi:MAG TPA: hypothetical protein VJS45_09190 [Acidimicrobiia bacterium]|nr:hypothetical protein [Acidimicrobiia bacterium]